ncbi:hypothetical protein BJ741DRAFT_572859 [Chytriomyces cf. hyalinus JEL632]|nr:hypothetical protein BJ741DRAFT_572859 [Chytriomyces cf. hyalinus JEL632]
MPICLPPRRFESEEGIHRYIIPSIWKENPAKRSNKTEQSHNQLPSPPKKKKGSNEHIPAVSAAATPGNSNSNNSNNSESGLPLSIGIPLLVSIGIGLLIAIVVLLYLVWKVCRETRLEREYIRQQLQRQYDHTPDAPDEPLPIYKSRDSENGFSSTVLPSLWERRVSNTQFLEAAPRVSMSSASVVDVGGASSVAGVSDSAARDSVAAGRMGDGDTWFAWSERKSSLLPMHGATRLVVPRISVSDVCVSMSDDCAGSAVSGRGTLTPSPANP